MKSKDWKPSLWISAWKRTTTTLKNMNWKTIIPKLALVTFALSAPAALSQEEILIITGKRADKTVFYQISPNARELDFSDNRLTSLTLPAGLTSLKDLYLDNNQLTSFTLPEGLTSLEHLYLDNNQLTSLTLPEDLAGLKDLTLATNQLTSLNLPENLSVWRWLDLSDNQLTSLTLPAGLSSLVLDLSNNQLTSFTLPESLTDSWELDLSGNQLTSLNLPENLSISGWLDLSDNQLASLSLPAGLSSFGLDLDNNRLTSLTLPAGLRLRELDLRNNPIEQLLFPEGRNIDNLELHGFSKENIERYTSSDWDGWVVILFSGGVLQYTENLSSEEWKDLPNAFPPFRISPTVAAQRFFRVLPFEPFYQKNVNVDILNGCFSWDSTPGLIYRIEVKIVSEDPWDGIEEIVADSEKTEWCPPDSVKDVYLRVVEIHPPTEFELSIEKEY